MERQQILNSLISSGIIAVIRLSEDKKIDYIISALSEGGVKSLEITMTTPNAIDIIKDISKKNKSDFLIGVGSVLDPETANAAIHSGAQFIVVENSDWEELSKRAATLVEEVRKGRTL